MKPSISVLLFFILFKGYANDILSITQLLNRIAQLQTKEPSIFPIGSIPSYRMYALNKRRYKADINPFFTGLTIFTLHNIKEDLSLAQQKLVEKIIVGAVPSFEKFKNRKGRDTYNFWPTDTPKIFTNGGWLNWFNKQQSLPDDMDDTVILLMAQQKSDSVAKFVHQLMQRYTNNEQKKINNTFPEYKKIGAYSTWFGVKMPVDFDLCVLSNILYFVQYYNLKWTAADSASLDLVTDIIASRKHITAANYVSPHYATVPNILYHISRLMWLKPIPELEKLKPQLIEDARQALTESHNFMDQVILSTALMRWGIKPPDIIQKKAVSLPELVENEDFCFFIASMASMLPNPYKKWVTTTKAGTFYYYSPAYNNVLLLENIALRNKLELSLSTLYQPIIYDRKNE